MSNACELQNQDLNSISNQPETAQIEELTEEELESIAGGLDAVGAANIALGTVVVIEKVFSDSSEFVSRVNTAVGRSIGEIANRAS